MPTSPHWAIRIRRRFPLKQIVPPGRCGHRPLRKSGGILQIPPLRSLFNSERGTMNHNDAFSRCHPLVNFLYFALVLLGAMVLRHPACQVISLIGAIACFLLPRGRKTGRLPAVVRAGAVRADRRREPRVQPRRADDPPLSPVRKPPDARVHFIWSWRGAHALHGAHLVFRLHAGHDVR